MRQLVPTWCKALGVLGLFPALAVAQVEPQYSPAVTAKLKQPEAFVMGDHYVKWADAGVAASGLAAIGFEAMGSSADHVFVDMRTGRVGTMIASLPLLPGVGNSLAWDNVGFAVAPTGDGEIAAAAAPVVEATVRDFAGTLGIDANELAFPGKITALDDGRLIHVWIPRLVDGVPVRNNYLTAVIRHGNLVLIGAPNWGDVAVARAATVEPGLAEQGVEAYLGEALPVEGWWRKPTLELVPVRNGGIGAGAFRVREGVAYRLVWAVGPRIEGKDHFEALVDAHSGEVLALTDTLHYGVESTREVVGGVFPVSNDGVAPDGIEQASWPMPFAWVTNGANTLLTDSGGNINTCVDGTIGATLEGPYVQIDDLCGATSESTSGDVLDFGTSGGTDCTVPGGASAGNTHAARTGFHELNRLYEMARSHVPEFAFLHQQIVSVMNFNSTCNATSGAVLTFYRSGGGCRNTGEIAGIFDHEWGHSMDRSDSVPSVSNPGEGIADIYASLRLNTSCIGRGFRSTNCTGYGNACIDCTGVRDIDWADHTANTPIVITGTGGTAIENCGFGNSAPCGGSVHCEGQVYSQAVWDLWNRDLTAGPFSFDLDRARELATVMTFNGATNVGQWYNCSDPNNSTSNNAVGDGCNANGGYLNYLAADDDDGNLANGTPHMTAIHAAFNRHQIACPTPTVQNSGCAGRPTTAPTLSATPVDRGTFLSWTAVAGAQRYRVLRADGVFACNFGKTIVAEVPAGTLSYLDSGALNGRNYSYQVVAVGAGDTCYGPVSSCQTVTPASGANLAGVPGSASLNITTGDADAFFDNCEQATLDVDLDNTGSVSLTNVRIESVDAPDGVFVLDTLPKAVTASLASCAGATASLDIYLAFQPPAGSIEMVLNIGADELGATTRPISVQIDALESDLQFSASKTFSFDVDMEGWTAAEGTVVRATAGGGASGPGYLRTSSGLDNQCDRGHSPLMVLATDSTLSLSTNYDIEDPSGGPWDRANVAVIEGDGTRTVVTPSSGRAYDIAGVNGACLEGQPGWAGTNATWAASNWSAAALGSAGLAGQPIHLEVAYATDPAAVGDGFRFDQVTVTNVSSQVPDAQSNLCSGGPFIFSDGFELGNTTAWSATVP